MKSTTRTHSCYICMQPIVENNRFSVSWSENGHEATRHLCGSRCLRDWAEQHSENIKLDLFDPKTPEPDMFMNVSAANLQTCSKCGNQYSLSLQECPKCTTHLKE